MEIKKILLMGYLSIISATCVIAQTAKTDYYQPSFTRSYEDEEDDAVSLFVDDDNKLNNFQRDAGLMLRNEKKTKRSSKSIERAYEKSAKLQKQFNQAEDRKVKENERAYFRQSHKENK